MKFKEPHNTSQTFHSLCMVMQLLLGYCSLPPHLLRAQRGTGMLLRFTFKVKVFGTIDNLSNNPGIHF